MKIIYIVVGLILTCTLTAQENLTLEKALSIGLENNFGIKISEANIKVAENNNSWAKAGSGVTLDLNGSFTNNIVNNQNPASFIQGTYYAGGLGASLDANWVVFSGGRIKVAKALLSKSVDLQELSKRSEVQELLRNIYQQYYEVLYQQEQLIVLESILETSKDRLAYEETKREFGSSNSYNIIQFENSQVTDSVNVLTQKQRLEDAKGTLYGTLNFIGAQNYVFDERLSLTDEEIDVATLKQVLSEENYSLKSLYVLAELNQLNTQLAESNRKPTVNLNGALGFTENGFKLFGDNNIPGGANGLLLSNQLNASLSAFFNWNLYDGGVKNIEVQNAKLQEEIDQLSLLEAQAQLNNQLDILVSNYENQRRLLSLSEEQLKLSKKNLDMTEERFKSGQLTSLDFRNVQNQYLNVSLGRVNVLYMLIMTKIEIDYLVGKFQN